MMYNLIYPPSQIRLSSSYNQNSLYEPAVHPPMMQISLFISDCPWTIAVHASTSHGLTVFDVLTALHQNLQITVQRAEYTSFPVERQQAASLSLNERSGGRAQAGAHAQRVDFLYKRSRFGGMVKANDGRYVVYFV